MSYGTTKARTVIFSPKMSVSCRVDFKVTTACAVSVHTGRLQSLSATGCTIRIGQHLQSGDALELWIYLPGLASVLQVNHAKVTCACLNEMSVEFVALAIAEQLRLGDYLADEHFVVDAIVGPPITLTDDNKEDL